MYAERVLSGMRPTGRLHLGHYHGVLKNWARLQYEYPCLFFVADWHALTTTYDKPEVISQATWEMLIDWLAAGIDPNQATLFIQSRVLEHAELHLLLSMITPLGWLERVPTYKDKLQQLGEQGKDINTYGFLGYPVLMTADIILYKADTVPVGEDQLPHLELAREMVRRFNFIYKQDVFPEPKGYIGVAPVVPGIDGRKMSKSYGNEIAFAASPDDLRARVRLMVTDPQRIKRTDPGRPEVCPVFTFHKLYSPGELGEIETGCRNAGIGCVDCKKRLAEHMVEALADIHHRRQDWASRPNDVKDILDDGAKRARATAQATMEQVRSVMHMG